jgi:putative ABC transport system permease protein
MIHDLRFAVRGLLKNPGFTLAAILTLALGIGANTAIFSVANSVLLRPLPYKDPERLAMVRLDYRGVSGHAGLAPAEVMDFRRQSTLFEGVEVINTNHSSLTGENMEKVPSVTITEGMFPLLGIRPFLGSGASTINEAGKKQFWDVVISYELWQRRFGGDREIIGKKIEINNRFPAVVGVLPSGFRLYLGQDINIPERVDIFFLGTLTGDGMETNRANHDYVTIARLKPGVGVTQAQRELDVFAGELTRAYPNAYENSNLRFRLSSLHQDLVQKIKPALWALLGAVGFVLLIACVNVANLVLTRTDGRAKEIAIRAALGAGRRRIIRQFLIENLLLALLGGLGGLALAVWGVELLLYLRPANLPRQDAIGVDRTALAMTFLLALVSGVLLGLAPAWRALKTDVNRGLKEGGQWSVPGQGRLQRALVIAEVALSLALLVGAGLMIRTFAALNRFDWGFNPDKLLTLQVNIQPSKFQTIENRLLFYQQALEKIRSLPGVESASGVTHLPLGDEENVASYAFDEAAATPSTSSFYAVLPDYFRSMNIRMLAGRDFTSFEIEQNRPLAIVDEVFARQAWPNENPIGKKLLWRPRSSRRQWLEVVGVVGHVKAGDFRENGRPQLYLPYLSNPNYDLSLVARGRIDLASLGPLMKQEIELLGTRRPVHTIRPMEAYVADQLAQTRFAMTLIGVLAVLALALCLVGLYSVIAYSVSRRTHEIGVRMALGAQGSDVLRLLVGQGMRLVGAGLVIGVIGAWALSRTLTTLLYGVSATDPLTFVFVAVILASASLAAISLPARRAARLNPLVALRRE